MQRNEYRRALIMLRSLLNGYSGHARAEIRTLMGNLSIRASVPQGAQSVRAALVGKRSSLYFAHPLGNLRRDMRGQAGLSVNFDPRDIGGRTLDAYSLLAVVTINDGVCELALVGNLNGSCENDWSRVRDVVCALYAPQPRHDGMPEAVPYSREAPPEENVAEEAAEPVQEATESAQEATESAQEACEGDSCPVTFAIPAQDNASDEPVERGLVWDFTPDEPDIAENIPEAFRNDGWKYAKTALPAGCGYAYAYVGTSECGNELCVALPGNFDTEPPAGLDDYQWFGDSGAGFWVKCYAAQEYE